MRGPVVLRGQSALPVQAFGLLGVAIGSKSLAVLIAHFIPDTPPPDLRQSWLPWVTWSLRGIIYNMLNLLTGWLFLYSIAWWLISHPYRDTEQPDSSVRFRSNTALICTMLAFADLISFLFFMRLQVDWFTLNFTH